MRAARTPPRWQRSPRSFARRQPSTRRVSDTANAATAYLDYTEVSGDIEGDALDRALVYNVAAIFAVYPDISAVRATLQEAYDSQWGCGHVPL